MDAITTMALDNWRDLNRILSSLREDQVAEMLDHEIANKARFTVINRLHERLTVLRSKRERAEIHASLL